MDIEQIPPLPNIVLQVMRYNYAGKNASVGDLANVISPDKAICAEITKIANSAYYGRSGKIKNIKDAVALLGLKSVKNLVIYLSTLKFAQNMKGKTFRLHLTEHPIFSALIALDLAGALDMKDRREDAFLFGLLHRIGMTMIALNKKDHYELLIDQSMANNFDLAEMEQQAYRTNHIAVGRLVCETWHLPEEFAAIIANLAGSPEEAGSADPMTRLVILAGLLARRGLGLPLSPREEENLDKLFDRFPNGDAVKARMNQEYFDMLKEHPFYAHALGN